MYKLYVIPGSHACRSAMLMLEHKGVPYRRVEFVTLTHPVMARLHGFDAGGETRVAGTRRTFGLRFGDRLGTVPGLNADGRRVSTNRAIARFLDERHPDPPLLPAEPERRRAVEDAERWANEKLQMDARRIPLSWARQNRPVVAGETANGRMGPLLYRHALARHIVIPWLGNVFPAGRDEDMAATLRGHLDRVDALIAHGVLNGPDLNVADFMVAPSLALILYWPGAQPIFAGRPALELVDRLLPAPA
jgi:glutathione S-transferase